MTEGHGINVVMGLNTTEDSREGITKYLLRNPNTCFVAEDNGKLVGVIMGGHDGRRGFIHHTTVRQEYRGRGSGHIPVRIQYPGVQSEHAVKMKEWM